MTQTRMLTVGIVGAVAAVVCCFSPILVVLFGAIGLSAWAGYLDYVLLPGIVVFAALIIYALVRRKSA
ncbi:MAG TPA: mercury resistance system transport protein MerF [Xanthobacteraceae bacterium]|nr:mercury resistance system transport protein MerF [Xanthobacteraceae bacterium]